MSEDLQEKQSNEESEGFEFMTFGPHTERAGNTLVLAAIAKCALALFALLPFGSVIGLFSDPRQGFADLQGSAQYYAGAFGLITSLALTVIFNMGTALVAKRGLSNQKPWAWIFAAVLCAWQLLGLTFPLAVYAGWYLLSPEHRSILRVWFNENLKSKKGATKPNPPSMQ